MGAKYHIQVKMYKEVVPNKFEFVKGFDSHAFDKELIEFFYNDVSRLEDDLHKYIIEEVEE